jgi:hypothetical protein
MKNYAQIQNNTVVNLLLIDENNIPDWVVPPEYIQSDTANIGDTYVDGQFIPYVPPAPTVEENKQNAVTKLQATDWTSIADVADPALSNPYLMNQAEFFAYRSALRAIAVNPTAGVLTWPTKPQEQWSS